MKSFYWSFWEICTCCWTFEERVITSFYWGKVPHSLFSVRSIFESVPSLDNPPGMSYTNIWTLIWILLFAEVVFKFLPKKLFSGCTRQILLLLWCLAIFQESTGMSLFLWLFVISLFLTASLYHCIALKNIGLF